MTLPPDQEVSFKDSVNLSFDLARATLEIPPVLLNHLEEPLIDAFYKEYVLVEQTPPYHVALVGCILHGKA